IAFSPTEDSIAIGMNDGVTRIWRWSTNTILATRAARREPVALTFSPDGRLVAETEQSSGGPSFAIWQADGGAGIYAFDSPERPPGLWYPTICFTHDGKYVIFTLGDWSVRLLSLSADDTVVPLMQFTTEARINDVAVDRSGSIVAVGSADGWVTVWDTESGPFAQRFDRASGVLASPVGDTIAILGANARIVSAGSGSAIADIGTESDRAVFSADGSRAAFASGSAVISVDVRSKKQQSWRVGAVPIAMCFASDGHGLLVAQEDGMLTSIDLASGSLHTIVKTKGEADGTFSPDGRFFGEKGAGTAIRVYDLAGGSVTELPSNASSPALCLSPRGDYVAGQPDNHSVAVWSTKTRKEVQRIPVHGSPSLMSFDSTGNALAVTDGAKVTIVDIPPGRKLRTFAQLGGDIGAISFSPDGHDLAAVSEDNSARIWRTADAVLVTTIPEGGVPYRARSVAFSGDGRYLLLQHDGVRSYLWQPADLTREACRRSIRAKLDETEWQLYLKGEPYRQTCDAATLH
ncbi:MAG: peptidase caspase catalytic subunit p20, partial [Acidobacteria bacterium]|nr:peptidase caspase catalytic subunit p20 [Acidobacteriota bacterium]